MRFLLALLIALIATTSFVALTGCGSDTDDTPPAKSDDGKAPTPKDSGSGDGAPPAMANDNSMDAATATRLNEAMQKGRAFLVAQRAENGGWGFPSMKVPPNVGSTAFAVLGLIASTDRLTTKTDENILQGLRFIAAKQADNGAIFDNPQYVTYHTSVSIGALSAARISEFANAQKNAVNFLADIQIRGDESDLSYGGFPYKQDSKGQPADLSNAQFAAEALYDGGLPKDHDAWKALRRFARRVQSNSEGNSEVVEVEVDGEKRQIVSGNDGGAFYGPGSAGVNKAGMVKRSDGKWEFKSYGSMSYALLKCLIFAGVDANDRRVQMVVKWISDHWTVDKNPGFENAKDPESASQQGFYYYLYTAARALSEYEKATGKPLTVKDADGRSHNWRKEIVLKIVGLQNDDGSWQNGADRWMEGAKVLATSYALQCLAFVTGRLP